MDMFPTSTQAAPGESAATAHSSGLATREPSHIHIPRPSRRRQVHASALPRIAPALEPPVEDVAA